VGALTETGKAVFLSYASQDAEAAQHLCTALRAVGIEVWFDKDELRGGDAWDERIRKQIHDCSLFVPIISAAAQARLEGYFRREWRLAVERTHDMADGVPFLVPVVIDNTKDQDVNVPAAFRAIHWTRLPAGETPPRFVERITDLLSPGNARPTTVTAHAGSTADPRNPARLWYSRFALPLVAGIAIIAVGYVAVDRLVLAKRTASDQAAAEADKSIAVLPFIDMSEGKDQQYLSDGLAEELLNLLSKVHPLRVIARASSFSFKGKDLSIAEVANKLNVTDVLEGSVRKSGNRLRIGVQLIRAADSSTLWSETYDRTLDDIFKVQDEIAAAVVSKLQITLLSAVPTSTVIDPKAYQLILQAKFFTDQRTPEGRAQGLELYKQALAISPNYAPAWDGLARVYNNQALYKERPAAEGFELARDALNKGLASDPSYAPSYARLGRIASEYDGDMVAAAKYFQRAMELGPNNLQVIGNTEVFVLNLGRVDEAIAMDTYVTNHDSANPANHGALGDDYRFGGRWDEAIKAYHETLALSPHYKFAHLHGAMVLLAGKKDATEALTEVQAESSELARTQGLALVMHALGKSSEADAALKKLMDEHGKDASYSIAAVFAFRGEADRSFEWLDKAASNKDSDLVAVFQDPVFEKIHRDPRWLAFLRKLGKAPEQLAAIELKVTLPK
jgi:TolB-like protein/tetratricopeptide (TPR) repeat protein